MVTLKELAADLGVSHALVSSVLNNRKGTIRVSEARREQILKRAQELNYTPNRAAVALKSGRTGVVGIFHHGLGVDGSEIDRAFMITASRCLQKHDLRLWLDYYEKPKDLLQACRDEVIRNVDGLLFTGLPHPELADRFQEILGMGKSVVTCWQSDDLLEGIPNFTVDVGMQTALPTRHLLERGCKAVAHFRVNEPRYQGYAEALSTAGIPVSEDVVVSTEWYTAEAGRAAMAELLDRGVPFDGLCAQSDAQAAGAMMELADRGVPRVDWPKITGVDDSPIARHYTLVPLTSTTTEMVTCARLSVEALVRAVNGGAGEGRTIPPQLQVRASTDPRAG